MLSFTTWTLLPKLYHGSVTSIILPFAVSNAIVAGSLYGILDLATGGPNNNNTNKILQTAVKKIILNMDLKHFFLEVM